MIQNGNQKVNQRRNEPLVCAWFARSTSEASGATEHECSMDRADGMKVLGAFANLWSVQGNGL